MQENTNRASIFYQFLPEHKDSMEVQILEIVNDIASSPQISKVTMVAIRNSQGNYQNNPKTCKSLNILSKCVFGSALFWVNSHNQFGS